MILHFKYLSSSVIKFNLISSLMSIVIVSTHSAKSIYQKSITFLKTLFDIFYFRTISKSNYFYRYKVSLVLIHLVLFGKLFVILY